MSFDSTILLHKHLGLQNIKQSETMAARPNDSSSAHGGSNLGKTVTFDVGGKIYRVSRSLLEQHPYTMLARLVSENWYHDRDGNAEEDYSGSKEDASNEDCFGDGVLGTILRLIKGTIYLWSRKAGRLECNGVFIERDGERFRYCLDYTRDGGVIGIPPTISKCALLKDLTYYGFKDVDPSNITVEASLSMYGISSRHIDDLIRQLDEEMEAKHRYLELAKECLCYYKRNASLEITVCNENLMRTAKSLENSPENREIFEGILNRIGLKIKRISCGKFLTYVFLDYL